MNKTLVYGLGTFAVVAAAFVLLPAKQQDEAPVNPMTPEDTSAIPQGDPLQAVAIPAEFSQEAQIGKRAFEAKCAVCHGENATGQNGVAPSLVNSIYRPGHHSDMAFVLAAKNGVRSHHWQFGNMPPVKGLTDADVKYIARYIRELQRENGVN